MAGKGATGQNSQQKTIRRAGIAHGIDPDSGRGKLGVQFRVPADVTAQPCRQASCYQADNPAQCITLFLSL
ncbi:hypothetical protein LDE03_12390 [Lactobacillus delbrueckii subsp. delbrueckii]|nr:hypothetical protein LDE03_12390 [Lactobacillus delbrueckii subsp. delbrueckii]